MIQGDNVDFDFINIGKYGGMVLVNKGAEVNGVDRRVRWTSAPDMHPNEYASGKEIDMFGKEFVDPQPGGFVVIKFTKDKDLVRRGPVTSWDKFRMGWAKASSAFDHSYFGHDTKNYQSMFEELDMTQEEIYDRTTGRFTGKDMTPRAVLERRRARSQAKRDAQEQARQAEADATFEQYSKDTETPVEQQGIPEGQQ
jgi:hypothetical protein